ncbi:MAG: hypothetical protein NTV81_01980 [Candidatus Komeilibacteria bacterium]|nr:hypothetical protein [Candidatus Komeilibacteria bacterium]
MDFKNLFLIVIASLNFLLGFYILSRNWRSQLRLIFFIFTIFTAFWSVCLALSNILTFSPDQSLLWSRLSYVGSIWVAGLFFVFGYYFPLDFKMPLRFFVIRLWPIATFTLWSLIIPGAVIQGLIMRPWGYDAIYNLVGYIIFSFLFLFYMAGGFYFMLKRYITSDGSIRINLRLVLIGTGIASIFGVIFDLILPFGNYWQLNWLGPYFSLVMILFVARIIFRK